MSGQYNIAVCGCGIGGLAVATLLARAGHRVVAYDGFQEPGPVGSGFLLQPTGLAVLRELGLLKEIEAHGRPIIRFFGHDAGTGRLVLDLRYDALRGNLCGLSVQRTAVFERLFDAAQQAGVQIEPGHEVSGSELISANRRAVRFTTGEVSPPFDLVIDALGQRSVLRSHRGKALSYGALWANLDWPENGPFDETAGEQRYKHAAKMIGVVPIGTTRACDTPKTAFFWSIKEQDMERWRTNPIDQWKDEVRNLWPDTTVLLDGISAHDDLTFAQYRHGTLPCPCDTALVHIGDSFHSTSPQLGQGANMALLDAYALTRGIETEPTLEAAFDNYLWARTVHVRLFQAMSWVFTPLYQSDSKSLSLLRDRVLAPLCYLPLAPKLLALTITGLLGRPLRKLGLNSVSIGTE